MASTGWGRSSWWRVSTGYVARETAGNLRRNLRHDPRGDRDHGRVAARSLGGVLHHAPGHQQGLDRSGGAASRWPSSCSPTVSTNETAAIGHELAEHARASRSTTSSTSRRPTRSSRRSSAATTTSSSVLGVSDMPPSYRVVPTKAQDISAAGRAVPGSARASCRSSYAAAGDRRPAAPVPTRLRLIGYVLAVRRDDRRRRARSSTPSSWPSSPAVEKWRS